MTSEFERLDKSKMVLQKIAKGVDPLTGELIKEDSFLQDPRIIRCFYFISEILDNVMNGVYNSSNRSQQFVITQEQKNKVELPQGKIGVTEFSKCLNQCIDINQSKKLNAVDLNKRLKSMGILGEVGTEKGKTRTVTNEKSASFGFELEKRTFNNTEYEMVVINDKGKKYLLDNIETIMQSGSTEMQH